MFTLLYAMENPTGEREISSRAHGKALPHLCCTGPRAMRPCRLPGETSPCHGHISILAHGHSTTRNEVSVNGIASYYFPKHSLFVHKSVTASRVQKHKGIVKIRVREQTELGYACGARAKQA
eukprot:366432-Chlamydomonas_euryale.AAC.7